MKVLCLSDLHGNLPLDLPEADLLVISGDICPATNHQLIFQARWLEGAFTGWIKEIQPKFKKILACWGNHDFIGEFIMETKGNPLAAKIKLPIEVLTDEGTEFDGLKIYGYPWQPPFFDWAFNAKDEKRIELVNQIPVGTDLIIAHGPPFGYGDLGRDKKHLGCQHLNERITHVKPKLVVCGHIHPGRGTYQLAKTIVVNASHVNEKYKPIHPPILITL